MMVVGRNQTNCSAAQGGKGVDHTQVTKRSQFLLFAVSCQVWPILTSKSCDQLTPAMLLGDSRGCLDAIQRIGARLLDAKKALIINSGRNPHDHC